MSVEQYLLGDGAAHARLCLITEILAKFVASAPRGMPLDTLAVKTGRPVPELLALCEALEENNLVKPHPSQPGCWMLAREACSITLEDAFRFVLAEHEARVAAEDKEDAAPARGISPAVDLLVMQAAMAINQSIFQHLRQFSLDRLKAGAGGKPAAKRDGDSRLRWSAPLPLPSC